ncbi:flagellar hook-length control protein FliK [Massilia sp. H6]|uniref:flagellar hook-length control protein FliK n=1 Tax=Massilia sp. H6 TaxID=2970464 RepID=UPI0021686268|nr:flagellar hook-length control protein FliK [Massilia sp. H6]UVW29715.1 flagellar hook-length control protein FliK [Massilia sp. H6]
MNITMNSAPLPAAHDAAGAIAGGAPADALPLDPALAPAQRGQPSALPFLQFMGLEVAQDVEPSPDTAAVPAGQLPPAELDAGAMQQDATATAQQDNAAAAATESHPDAGHEPLLAAMAMPLMQSMMMTMPAPLRVPAAMPQGALAAEAGATPGAGAASAGAVASGAALPGTAAGIELPLAAGMRQAPDAPAPVPVAATVAASPAGAGQVPAQAAPAQATALHPPPAAALPAGPQGRESAAPEAGTPPAAGTHAGFGVAAPAAASVAARDGATLTLSGPPTAWRQSLQEALGERLSLQLTKNAEQATIRLEPPMLGRVEISIRHIAGALEVNITATHSEVLRQLNTVSDNLRGDLAGRQYTDVSVNISQAPRAQASAQAGASFGADAQGRGREHDQEKDQDQRAPGAALAEAHHTNTAFSLNGRA